MKLLFKVFLFPVIYLAGFIITWFFFGLVWAAVFAVVYVGIIYFFRKEIINFLIPDLVQGGIKVLKFIISKRIKKIKDSK